MSDEGVRKSAALMLALGQDEAAQVMKYLEPKEVQRLGVAMANLGHLSREQMEAILEEFQQETAGRLNLGDTDEYLRAVLSKALGDDKAMHIIERIIHSEDNSGIKSLKWLDAGTVAEMIRNEHPQIIATILAHLERDHAGAILGLLPERLRNDVLMRIATLEGVQPMAMRELNDVLANLLAGGEHARKGGLGGVKAVAEILNFMGSAMESSVLESIRAYDNELAQRIQDEMFTFDDIARLDDRSIQLLLREVPSEALVVALKGTSQELKDKIFKNMSSRAAEALKEDFEAKGPVRLSEVEAQQKEILKIVRRLVEEGQIVIGGKGGGDGMVE
ncbi:MAG: flagellar motor switch protein FliG [Thiobacillaceae bacterium]|nr:flagellar motor switch protein FliG [Thiobacillaceae bacterium]MDW8322494.1 flagellar motor switch protein FliG [Burkholderiales bacterium]